MDKIHQRIATELRVGVGQVTAAAELLGEGATVPFIARYRKEKTGGLDDTQLRRLEERLGYLRELEDRRATVLKTIDEQGKLTPELVRSIDGAQTKVELEDLYAPFKPKRRTKASIARERGLEPLAQFLQDQREGWALVEQDVDADQPGVDPYESAVRSRQYLRAVIGI